MKNINKTGIVKDSWGILKKNYKVVAIAVIIYIVFYLIQSLFSILPAFIFGENTITILLSLFFSLFFYVIYLIIQIGYLRYFLKIVDNKTPVVKDIYSYSNPALRVLRFFVASIIYGLMIVGGLILLIIPGIYIALRYQFYTYLIADKNLGIMDSLKKSAEITKDKVIDLFLFALLIIIINILGFFALGIGLFITIPLTFIAWALLYRKLNPPSV